MPHKGPSGRTLDLVDFELIRAFHRIGFIQWKDDSVTLNSGITSRILVQGRDELTTEPRCAAALARKVIQTMRPLMAEDPRQPCVIGVPTTGTFIANAVVFNDYYESRPALKVCTYTMREKKKDHGLPRSWIVGVPRKDFRFFLIDNALTTGKSILDAYQKLGEDGFDTSHIECIVVVDRRQGGLEHLASQGITRVHTLYNLLDIVAMYVELGLWPKQRFSDVAEDLRLRAI